MCNILQSLQLIFNVGIIILGNGQGLSQIAKFRVCFSVCMVIWTVAGMILGQVKTLQVRIASRLIYQRIHRHFWKEIRLARESVGTDERLRHHCHDGSRRESLTQLLGDRPLPGKSDFNILPRSAAVRATSDRDLTNCIFLRRSDDVSLFQCAYIEFRPEQTYVSLSFTEFMAEMRKPMDFWKGMACAQVFITTVYMVFGVVIYHYQGQVSGSRNSIITR